MNFQRILRFIHHYISSYRIVYIIALLVISFILIGILTKDKKKTAHKTNKDIEICNCNRALYATAPIVPQRILKDSNELQLLHAQANGLKEIYISNQAFEEDSAMLIRENRLVKLKNNSLYRLKDLTHSYPYVTPEMAQLLNDIGLLFRQKLREKKQDHYQFLISSALRTAESQGSLSSRNRNATTLSTHLYGTTIDITYKEFFNTKADSVEQNIIPADALRETMLDLREQCRLLAVRERRQACYHFTVVNCDPSIAPKDSTIKHHLTMPK